MPLHEVLKLGSGANRRSDIFVVVGKHIFLMKCLTILSNLLILQENN